MLKKTVIPFVALMISASLVGCGSSSNNNTGSSTGGSSTGGSSTGGSSTGGSSTGGSSTGGSSTGGSSTGGSSTGGSSTGGSSTGGSSTGGSSTGGSSTGGSSTGGSSTGGSSGGMTGNCINIPSPVAGQKSKLRSVTLGAGGGTVDVEVTFKSFSNTSVETDTVTTGDVAATGNKVGTHTVNGNFIDTSKIVTKDTTTITVPVVGSITTVTDLTLGFSPAMRAAFGTVCEGDVWNSTYDLTTSGSATTSGVTNQIPATTLNQSVNFTIESVNVSQTVTAGTFTTYQQKREDGTTVDTTWFDVATGVEVKSESRNNSGALISTQELISNN